MHKSLINANANICAIVEASPGRNDSVGPSLERVRGRHEARREGAGHQAEHDTVISDQFLFIISTLSHQSYKGRFAKISQSQ